MSGSVSIWLAWALVLFWATGAYNRLVRLRSQAIAAFGPLDEQLRAYVALIQRSFPKDGDIPSAFHAGLVHAAAQFDSSLQSARGHPLDVMTLRALAAAHEILWAAWGRLCHEPGDLAGDPLPETLLQQWQHIAANADLVRTAFNRNVQNYNDAIAQFPARVLAWLFGFKPAQTL